MFTAWQGPQQRGCCCCYCSYCPVVVVVVVVVVYLPRSSSNKLLTLLYYGVKLLSPCMIRCCCCFITVYKAKAHDQKHKQTTTTTVIIMWTSWRTKGSEPHKESGEWERDKSCTSCAPLFGLIRLNRECACVCVYMSECTCLNVPNEHAPLCLLVCVQTLDLTKELRRTLCVWLHMYKCVK